MASYQDRYRYRSSPPAKRRALAPMDANANTAAAAAAMAMAAMGTTSPRPFGLCGGKPATPSRLAPRKTPRHPQTPHSYYHPLSHGNGPVSGVTLAGSPIKRAPSIPRHSTSPLPARSSAQQQEHDQERDQNVRNLPPPPSLNPHPISSVLTKPPKTFQISDTRSPSPESSSLFDVAPDPNADDTCCHHHHHHEDTSSHPHPRHLLPQLPLPPQQPRADEAAVTRDQARRIRARLRLAMYKVRTSQADKTLGQLELGEEKEDYNEDDEENGTWEAAEKGVRGDLRV